MAVSRVTVSGIDDARKRLAKFLHKLEENPSAILIEEAPRIQAEARVNTPRRSGDLIEGTTVTVSRSKREPGLNAKSSSFHRGYDYAYKQHENFSYNHPNGGKAKYLEDAYVAGVDRIIRRFESEVTYDE